MKTMLSNITKFLLVTLLVAVAVGCAAPAPTTAPQATDAPKPTVAAQPTAAPKATDAPKATTAPAAQPMKYNEAPTLAEQVKAGKLPPIEQRLPKQPVVIKPFKEVGQYGGTWRTVWGGDENMALNNHMRYARLLALNEKTGLELKPDICDWYKASPDGKEFTFHIREGIRWSDGQPYTTEDIKFYWEDVMNNTELNKALPTVYRDNVPTFEFPDQYTFKVTFKQPYGFFPVFFAMYAYEDHFVVHPKHYLKQFHVKYAPKDQLDAAVQKAGLKSWTQLFQNQSNWMLNPDLPAMTAWVVKSAPDASKRTIWERNPYFYQVDTAGNQLPYIDRVEWTSFANQDLGVLKAAAGEIDMNIRFFSETSFVPLKQNEAKGNYKIVPYYAERGSENSAIHFNLTTKDPVLRQIFNDVRFRQAASLAIDRAEANKVSWLGLGRPRQASYPSVSPHYMPEWEKHFAQYDPKEANRLLDEMGLTKKDSAGFRLRPDGQTLELVWETSGPPVRPWQELVKEYLGKIGIKIIIQPRENYAARVNSPELQMGMWMFGGDLPRMREDLIPVGSRGGWGTEWKRWFDTGGKEGEKPPEDLIKVNDLINQSYATADQKETIKLAQDAGRIHMKNLWIIGVVGEAPRAGVIKNNFKNLPEDLPYGGYLPEPAIWAAQFFMTK